MSEQLGLLHIGNFSGGLNVLAEDTLIADNEAKVLTNWEFSKSGPITKRKGSLKYNSSEIASSPVHSLFRAYLSDGTKFMLAIVGSTLYKGNDGAGTWASVGSVTTTNPATFAMWQDKVYIANGHTLVHSYDGTTLATVATSPEILYIAFHRDRLYGTGDSSNPNTLYYSDIGDPATWDTAGNVFQVRENDGDVSTGIAPMQDFLAVYKKNSIWMLAGNSDSDFSLFQVSASIGCDAPKSLVAYENLHYFLDRTGVYVFNGSQLTNISEKIQPVLDDIPRTELTTAVAVVYNRQYLLAHAKSGSAENDSIVMLDLRLGGWVTWEGLNVSSFTLWDGGDDEGEIYAGDSGSGFARRLDTGLQDDSTDITVQYESKHFSLGQNPLSFKVCKLVHMMTEFVVVSPVLTVNVDWSSQSQSLIFSIASSVALFDVALFDVDVFAIDGIKTTQKALRIDPSSGESMKGRFFNLSISETSSVSWKMVAIGLAFSTENEQYKILENQ